MEEGLSEKGQSWSHCWQALSWPQQPPLLSLRGDCCLAGLTQLQFPGLVLMSKRKEWAAPTCHPDEIWCAIPNPLAMHWDAPAYLSLISLVIPSTQWTPACLPGLCPRTVTLLALGLEMPVPLSPQLGSLYKTMAGFTLCLVFRYDWSLLPYSRMTPLLRDYGTSPCQWWHISCLIYRAEFLELHL